MVSISLKVPTHNTLNHPKPTSPILHSKFKIIIILNILFRLKILFNRAP